MLGSSQGELGGGNSLASRERAAEVWSGRAALWVVQFVLCILLICIVVVTVPFVYCSVKLPLSRPTSFCLFLSILLRTLAGGGAAAWRFSCQLQPNLNKHLWENWEDTKYVFFSFVIINSMWVFMRHTSSSPQFLVQAGVDRPMGYSMYSLTNWQNTHLFY